ncbi:MAG: NAD-dependent epimerase/dehydratase family protein [Oscillospiraceae bacterium]
MANKAMPILITGSSGFVGKNLVCRLANEDYTDVMCYDIDVPHDKLYDYVQRADFIFHLAGVNRPVNKEDFYTGNRGLTEEILHILEQNNRKTPLLLSSSIQALLDNDYGKSKKAAEDAVLAYGEKCGTDVYVYRLQGVFGKWCRPAYNSVVATFCYNVAHGIECEVRDAQYKFPLIYIDDVAECFLHALQGKALRDEANVFCRVEPVYEVSLGNLRDKLLQFKESRKDLSVADMSDKFTSKLYSTYLSYLDMKDFAYPLVMNTDERGSFTEFLRTDDRGQVSVNISKPHIVKGNHWHDSKNEKFLVVKGKGIIRFRAIGSNDIHEYKVSGDKLVVVDIPTGYTHNIENVGDDDMVTVMWVNEPFNKDKPDTYFLKV